MTRIEREELNSLSKQVFGSSSKWQKIVNEGILENYERDREAMVPLAGGFIKKVFTDRKSVLKRYTVDEIRKIMEDALSARNAGAKTDENGHFVLSNESFDNLAKDLKSEF